METVFKAIALYVALLILFRITGRRSLQQTTTFDLVLLLVIGEAAQPALIGNDNSLTTAVLAVATLLSIDVALSLLKRKAGRLERLLEGQPTIIVMRGTPLPDQLRRARIDAADVLQAARERQGILRMEDIGLAVLEANGSISIIPAERL
ncbi:DUF421 domain-containing protein [Roseomonas terrae]|uniref:DUF421 domain-containing protein n=1 Tax=Neoroseomonas terrae TaxID=424799 RepID=A0ABS5EF11_9PROT|nr:YetF domain-containing protein [Neoroseomonas terrae]MBR0649550.1 DUF421 domain-containing protein [Neoroseomonas terrae]